jgi:hypothetical protein
LSGSIWLFFFLKYPCSVQPDDTPAVYIVVYGNRMHDEAILGLKHILKTGWM